MGLIEPTLISHPFRSSLGAMDNDIDALASVLKIVKEEQAKLRECEQAIRYALGNLTSGATRTRRLQGNEWTLKLEFPNPYWSQTILKKLWAEPRYVESGLVATYLKIDTIGVQLREVNKLRTCEGNELFSEWKTKLLAAEEPSQSPPTISFEKGPEVVV